MASHPDFPARGGARRRRAPAAAAAARAGNAPGRSSASMPRCPRAPARAETWTAGSCRTCRSAAKPAPADPELGDGGMPVARVQPQPQPPAQPAHPVPGKPPGRPERPPGRGEQDHGQGDQGERQDHAELHHGEDDQRGREHVRQRASCDAPLCAGSTRARSADRAVPACSWTSGASSVLIRDTSASGSASSGPCRSVTSARNRAVLVPSATLANCTWPSRRGARSIATSARSCRACPPPRRKER